MSTLILGLNLENELANMKVFYGAMQHNFNLTYNNMALYNPLFLLICELSPDQLITYRSQNVCLLKTASIKL